jgi:CheY-like chemotaxis protein
MNDHTVLVIDDEEYIRRLIRFVLERAGFAVRLAASTEEGLRMSREDPPDVISVDLMMPGRSGLDFLADMRADPATALIPIIVVTAAGIKADVDRALELGATGLLYKPFSQSQLIEAINAALPGGDSSGSQGAPY